MKKIFLIFMFVYILIIIFPSIITYYFLRNSKKDNQSSFLDPNIKIQYSLANKEISIDLEDYIKGVVAAEMPALFDEEALKAQAVCSRTYAYKKIKDGIKNANLISQEFLEIDEIQKKFGQNFKKYFDKISNAVDSTKGQIIFYDNKPIDAVFHAMSAGITEDSEFVWAQQLPYLKSVDSSLEKNLDNFEDEKIFSQQDFFLKFDIVDIKDYNIKILKTTSAGYVTKLIVGKKEITGNSFRKILDLRSTNFIIKKSDNQIKIITKGYGHGAGLSQNGANLMAKQGYKYDQIIKHYYQGVVIGKLLDENIQSIKQNAP